MNILIWVENNIGKYHYTYLLFFLVLDNSCAKDYLRITCKEEDPLTYLKDKAETLGAAQTYKKYTFVRND
jgi:hypothetical protein